MAVRIFSRGGEGGEIDDGALAISGPPQELKRGDMVHRIAIGVLLLASVSYAHDSGLSVTVNGRQKYPAAEAEKIYNSSCAAVKQDFGDSKAMCTSVVLILGADQDGVDLDRGRVLLTKWDRGLFAEGVVMLTFQKLLPVDRTLTLAKRALNWADATIEIGQLAK